MTAKHTQGPWALEKQYGEEWWYGGKNGAQIVIHQKNGQSYDAFAVLGATLNRETEADANARLIAAAPELLEALQLFVAWSKAENNHTPEVFWDRVEMLSELDRKAAAAIAKATGEQV